MILKFKIWGNAFFRGSHHKLNGFNLLIIIIMLFVMAYHVSITNQNMPQIVTNKKQSNDPSFFRYPASESQKKFRKSRLEGYAESTVERLEDTNKWVISVTPKESLQPNLKYKWILKEGITHVSGDLEGSVSLTNSETINIVVESTTEDIKTLLAVEIYNDGNIKTGYVHPISLVEANTNPVASLGNSKAISNEKEDSPKTRNKKLKIMQ